MQAIDGTCDPKFQPVADAFEKCFSELADVGSSVCVTVEGDVVVDLWGGYANEQDGTPWARDTISFAFSASKGPVAIAMQMLAERRQLDIGAPVAQYWPEFARNGKGDITLRQVMSHMAGVPFIDAKLPIGAAFDWSLLVHACEEQAPEWEPGTQPAYHSFTFGIILGEVVRRVTGVTLGKFLRQEVSQPLGADFFIGLPESEDHRMARIDVQPWPNQSDDDEPEPLIRSIDFLNLPDDAWSSRDMRAAELPGGNGISNGRGLAFIYRPLALGGEYEGVRVLENSTIEAATELQASGLDATLGNDLHKRTTGFELLGDPIGVELSDKAFGHAGFGGQFGIADPAVAMSFGYVTTKLIPIATKDDARGPFLAEAAYACITS